MIGMRGKYNQEALRSMCKDLSLKGKTMLEIGSYAGEGTEVFSEFCEKVYTMDPWLEGMSLAEGAVRKSPLLMDNIVEQTFDKMAKKHPNIVKLKGFDYDFLDQIPDNSLDYVYIDSLHTEKEIRRQITAWLPKLKSDGIIGGHDYNTEFPGTIRAVNSRLGGPDKTYFDGGTSWSRKVENIPLVHFILTGDKLTYPYRLSIETAIKNQVGRIILWTNQSIKIPGLEVREVKIPKFKALKGKPEYFIRAHTKDYLTYKILFEYGGTCLDLDTISIQDVSKLRGDKEVMVMTDAREPFKWKYVRSLAIVSAQKGSPIIKESLNECKRLLEKETITWADTSTVLMSKMVEKYPDKFMLPSIDILGGFEGNELKKMYEDTQLSPELKVMHLLAYASKDLFKSINKKYIETDNSLVAKLFRTILYPKWFVEIGSNYFETLNHLADQGWKGLIVEAVPEYFNKLEKKQGVIYENVAIGEKDGEFPFYYIPEKTIKKLKLPDWARGLGSFGKHPDIKTNGWEKLVKEIKIPVTTIEGLLNKYGIDHINLLKIDTEGYDCKILLGMNIEGIDKIQFEHKHSTAEDLEKVKEKLKGYSLTYAGDNILATKDE